MVVDEVMDLLGAPPPMLPTQLFEESSALFSAEVEEELVAEECAREI